MWSFMYTRRYAFFKIVTQPFFKYFLQSNTNVASHIPHYLLSQLTFHGSASNTCFRATPPSHTLLISTILIFDTFQTPDVILSTKRLFSWLLLSSFNKLDKCRVPTAIDSAVSSQRACAVYKLPSDGGPMRTLTLAVEREKRKRERKRERESQCYCLYSSSKEPDHENTVRLTIKIKLKQKTHSNTATFSPVETSLSWSQRSMCTSTTRLVRIEDSSCHLALALALLLCCCRNHCMPQPSCSSPASKSDKRAEHHHLKACHALSSLPLSWLPNQSLWQ